MTLLNTIESIMVAYEKEIPEFVDSGIYDFAKSDDIAIPSLAEPTNLRKTESANPSEIISIKECFENKKPEEYSSGSIGDSYESQSGISNLSSPTISCNGDVMTSGFIMLQRAAIELVEKDPDAFLLLTLIALRARRDDSLFDRKLTKNQAYVGDYKSCGLTRQRYRDALGRLESIYGLITSKGTNKGTIATLLNSEVYDINSSEQKPPEEPTRNQQGTTNNKNNNINSSSAKPAESEKTKKPKPTKPKACKPKEPKPEPTPEELELKKQRKITMDIAQKVGFPLAPAEINAQIKKYSLEAVRFVINLYSNGDFKSTQPEYLRAAIYKRIQSQHDYNEEFTEYERQPNAS